MTVHELNREQLIQLKQDYLCQLADCGEFAEIVGVDYDCPSWGDLKLADEIVPDEFIFAEYNMTNFVEEDFI